MPTLNPIQQFIQNRLQTLNHTRHELAQRIGTNTNKSLRRFDQLMAGNRTDADFIHRVATALEVPFEDLMAQVTHHRLAVQDAEDQVYRAAFKPHVVWRTERTRPSSITLAGLTNASRFLHLEFPEDLEENHYVAYCQHNAPEGIPFFGKVVGFIVNESHDHAVVYDLNGQELKVLRHARRLPVTGMRLCQSSNTGLPPVEYDQ